MSLSYTVSEL